MVSQTLGCESCMAHTNLKSCIQVLLPCPFPGTALEICAGVYKLQGVKANVGNQRWDVLGWRVFVTWVMLWTPQRPLEILLP